MDNSISIDSLTGGKGMKYYSTKIDTDADQQSYLDFDSYLQLLASQMSNQDFNDPMSDSEFLSQMASYSMMEAIGTMNQQSQISYATSLVGKAVTVNDNGTVDTGIVESVIIGDDKYYLLVNGQKYTTDQVSDVVDTDVYKQLSTFIGQECTIEDSKKGTVAGTISNIIVQGGKGYVVVNGEIYSVSDVKSIGKKDDADNDKEDTDDKTEGTETDTDNTTETNTDTASVNGYNASMNMPDDGEEVDMYYYGYDYNDGSQGYIFSDELFGDISTNDVLNNLMKDLEAKSGAETSVQSAGTVSYDSDEDEASDISSIQRAAAEDIVTFNAGNETDFSSIRVSMAAANGSIYNNDEEDEGILSQASVDEYNAYSNDNGSTSETSGITQSIANAAPHRITNPVKFTSYPAGTDGYIYGSNKYFEENGISSDNRVFSADYPDEAAQANANNTKMLDIRYINNSRVNSEINTDTILGFTNKGKAFTDIGYSGKGMLGEVITWADGTQRVEIIQDSGSSWFTTTGRYTLDQICNFSSSYDLGGKLTPFETVIRAAAKEYTADEQSLLDSFGSLYSSSALRYWSEN